MATRWITEADTADPTSPESAKAVETASWLLYKLTAEKYPGITERVEWYGIQDNSCGICVDSLIAGSEYYQGSFALHHHVWYNSTEVQKIRLRGYPVRSVSSISENGVVVDPLAYRIENGKYLVKKDSTCWNTRGGLEITYSSGVNPPEAGKQAAIRLANEFILANTGSTECALPERVTSISRQGIDYTILDPQDFLDHGRTGIYEVDAFIRAANPTRAKKKPRVFIPDAPRGTTRL